MKIFCSLICISFFLFNQKIVAQQINHSVDSTVHAAPHFTQEQLNNIISKTKIVMIEFSATWCGPCKKMAPIIDELEKENPKQLKVVRVDYDINRDLAKQNNIYEIPYTLLYINGKLKENLIGVMPKEHIEEMMKE
jgi:thioredoxin